LKNTLTISAQTFSYLSRKEDIDKLFYAYKEVFSLIENYLMDGILKDNLDCEPSKPFFL
jgi:hypothetical protein